MTDAEIIETLGGATAVARRLGFKTPDGARRVHNWIKRGIPPRVKLDHAALFKKAATSMKATAPARGEAQEAAHG
ncbi:MAG: hypothetical protein ACD_23C00777G0002 [uncultured bacterium]|nr:MAG: hypothetical protein ACD_23C00777G0002 [uncultured bacterium]